MLALYHLFSGTATGELLGVDEVLKIAGTATVPGKVKRVVLVGNKLSPGNPVVKPDGTVVHTLPAPAQTGDDPEGERQQRGGRAIARGVPMADRADAKHPTGNH
jgi:hypothetical protein